MILSIIALAVACIALGASIKAMVTVIDYWRFWRRINKTDLIDAKMMGLHDRKDDE